jgi:hypothetical protein
LSEAGVGKNMGDGLSVIGYRLSVIGYRLSVIGVKGPRVEGEEQKVRVVSYL